MEIKIKKSGKGNGTVGDLREGLESGKYNIEEYIGSKTGTHGLCIREFLNGKNVQSWTIACYDQYDYGEKSYRTVDDFGMPGQNPNIFSFAAQKTLLSIGEKWCAEMNEMLETEEVPEVKIVRVDIQ